MYRYLDRPVGALGTSEAFLLWAARAAVAAMGQRICLGAELGPAFGRHDLAAGLPHFAMAMALLSRDSEQPLEVMTPGTPRVSEGEAVLLELFGASDPQADARVHATLALVLPNPELVTAAHRAVRRFTAVLVAAGMAPPIPDSLTGEEPRS